MLFLLNPLSAQEAVELQREWQQLVVEQAGFSIWVPGEMKEKIDTIETAIGELRYHTFFYNEKAEGAENFVYMISYCDYPEGSIHSDSTDLLPDFFETTIESASFSVAGDVIYENEIFLGNYPGRFWRINYLNDQAVIRTKAYMVENRFFSIQAVMRKEFSLNKASDRFLDSFQLLKP